jgi:RNA polymerase sigma-70 factor (ECF subfamily)
MTTAADERGGDDTLYRAARQGNSDAFGVLYARHRDGLYRFLVAWSGDRLLAEDVAQDAFVAVMTRGPMGSGAFRFRAYLYRVAMNRARDVFRRRGYETVADSEPTLGDVASSPAAPFTEAVETADALRQALEGLSREQRMAVSLHYFADLPVQQVAEVIGVPVGTVKTRLARAYPRLLAALRKGEGS